MSTPELHSSNLKSLKNNSECAYTGELPWTSDCDYTTRYKCNMVHDRANYKYICIVSLVQLMKI